MVQQESDKNSEKYRWDFTRYVCQEIKALSLS